MDFMALLEESFSIEQPERGDVLTGTILAIDHYGIIVDVGMKRDGVVPRSDLERMEGMTFKVGDEATVVVIQPEDQDGNLVVSLSQARQSEDWVKAEELLENGETFEGVVTDANRGGLIIPFGNLRGFVPASHVMDLPRGLNENDRKGHMNSLVGRTVLVKVIEVNRKRRRLVLSQRDAQRGRRDMRKESLLDELQEGEVRKGVVSGLRDFGAFVDLGGADGLIHISELAWHRVKHPKELLNVGDEIDVFILRLDKDGKRIGLSLKRLQPNPWAQIDELYHVGQLVEGEVSRVQQFGAFVSLEPGIEALLHASQMADPAPEDPMAVLREGQKLLMRVISIESHRQRLGLSLKDVTEDERDRWTAEHGTILTVVPPGTGASENTETDVDSELVVEEA
jgi:small subunit ribosomal protein S1